MPTNNYSSNLCNFIDPLKLNILFYVFGQELGLYKAQTKLPFNAFGTMAMARDVRTQIHTISVVYKYTTLIAECKFGNLSNKLFTFIPDRSSRTILLQARYFGY